MNERDIFMAALDIDDPTQREAYLDHACGGDAAARARIASLLAVSGEASQFLEAPPAELLVADEPYDTEDASRTVVEDQRQRGSRDQMVREYLQASDHPGALGRLGSYELLEPVGEGGMGMVYRALDTKLNRIVALKILAPELAANGSARQRFVREGLTAAAVNHSHVVTIHAVDDAKLPYLVMEFIGGRSLQERLDALGPPPLNAILRIASQIASGLAAAHKEGVIHRDIKPGNILLENGVERVKITDFGLARAADDVAITRSGFIAGTPQYMSPEQAHGEQVDARSDLFSLGSVMYAMCTGRPPFRAETTVGVLKRVCEDTPRPIHEVNPEIPPWLEAIVNKLLAKKPEDRFQTAHEVAELLSECLAHVQNPSAYELPSGLHTLLPKPVKFAPPEQALPKVPGRRGSASPYFLKGPGVLFVSLVQIGIAVAIIVSAATYLLRSEGTLIVVVDDPDLSLTIDGREVNVDKSGVEEIRLAPGQYRVVAKKNGQVIRTEIANIVHREKTVVELRRERPQEGTVPAVTAVAEKPLSPMLRRARSLVVRGFHPNWTPDGKCIVLTRSDESAIEIINAQTGENRPLVSAADVADEGQDAVGTVDGVISPDGQQLAFVKRPRSTDSNKYFGEEVWLMSLSGGKPRRIAAGGYPSWGADAKTLYIHDRTRNILQSIDLLDPSAAPCDLFPCPTWYPVVSPNGKYVAFIAGSQLRIVELATGETAKAWNFPGPLSGMLLSWSPDSREVGLYPYHQQERKGLWIYELAANRAVQVSQDPLGEGAWSPLTREFAFTSNQELLLVALHPGKSTTQSLQAEEEPAQVERFVDPDRTLTEEALGKLLAHAASITTKQWHTLAGDQVGPDMAAITGTPLSLVLMELNPRQEAMFNHEVIKDFWFLTATLPKPATVSEAISIHADQGYVSFIQPEYITGLQAKAKDGALYGEVEFVCPKLYTGKVRFVARKKDGDWQINALQLPHYKIAIALQEGVWRKVMWKDAEWHERDNSAEAIPIPVEPGSS